MVAPILNLARYLRRQLYYAVPALLILSWASSADAQQAIASIDRNPVVEHSAFTLTVTSAESLTRDAFVPEQLISDFEIRGTSVSSSTSIINGERSRTTEWRVTLLAPGAGSYTIPSFAIGSSRTAPIQVEVIAATEQPSQNRNSFIEASLSNENPYVQQQVTYTVKLYLGEQLETGSLSLPALEHASVEQLGQDRQSQEVIDGKLFQVLTRTYAITPRRSGEFTVPGVRFDGRVRRTQPGSFSALGRIEPVSTRSPDLAIEVRPRPAGFVGEWLPSEQVTLEEQWEPESTRYIIGEPITRRITITAAGARPEQLPMPLVQYPDEFRVYPDRGQQESTLIRGIPIARATYTAAIVPASAGEFTLPAVRIPWWNTRTEKLEFAELPERSVTISVPPGGLHVPGSVESERSSPSSSSANQAVSGDAEHEIATAPKERTELITYWQLASALLAAGWLLTGLLWWLNRTKQKAATVEHVPLNVRQSLHNLKLACKNNSAPLVRSALLAWHQERTGEPARGLFHVASALNSEALATHLHGIEATLYSKEPQQWRNGAELWKCVQGLHQKSKPKNGDLPHLYPH